MQSPIHLAKEMEKRLGYGQVLQRKMSQEQTNRSMNSYKNYISLPALSIGAGLIACMSFFNSFAANPGDGRFKVEHPVQLDFARVPGGSFMLGDMTGTGQQDERPVKPTDIKGFWMPEMS